MTQNFSGSMDVPSCRPFLDAARSRDVKALETLVKSGVDVNQTEPKTENTALHLILNGGCFSDNCVQKSKACLELLLGAREGADPNKKNSEGKCPLDLVVDNMIPTPLAVTLISHGASLASDKGLGNSLLARNISGKMPEVATALLDRAVSFAPQTSSLAEINQKTKAKKAAIQLDFSNIVYDKEKTLGRWMETKFLSDILSSDIESRKLLLGHPLVKAFLSLKKPLFWRHFGYFHFIWHLITLILYLIFIWVLYNDECAYKPPLELTSNATRTMETSTPLIMIMSSTSESSYSESSTESDDETLSICRFGITLTAIAYGIIIMFILGPAILEWRKLIAIGPKIYVWQWKNWVFLAAITAVFMTLWPALSLHRTFKLSWQYGVAALGMLIGSLSILVQITPINFISLYLEMLFKIFIRIMLATIALSPLLIGFFFSFRILITNEKIGPFAILQMIVSDSDFESLKDANRGLFYDIIAYFFFSAFIIIVTIVLLNFLIGLAVSDVEELKEFARVQNLTNQVRSYYICDAIFGKQNKRHYTVTLNGTRMIYTFDPLDSKDKRGAGFPDDLKLELLRLARKRCFHPDPAKMTYFDADAGNFSRESKKQHTVDIYGWKSPS